MILCSTVSELFCENIVLIAVANPQDAFLRAGALQQAPKIPASENHDVVREMSRRGVQRRQQIIQTCPCEEHAQAKAEKVLLCDIEKAAS